MASEIEVVYIKNAAGMYVRKTKEGVTAEYGVYDENNLTGGICVEKINGQSGTKLTLKADVIDIEGLITALRTKSLLVANMTMAENAYMLGSMTYQFIPVLWKSQSVVTSVTRSGSHYFLYASSQSSQTPSGSASGTLVTAVNTTTINYLGMDNT